MTQDGGSTTNKIPESMRRNRVIKLLTSFKHQTKPLGSSYSTTQKCIAKQCTFVNVSLCWPVVMPMKTVHMENNTSLLLIHDNDHQIYATHTRMKNHHADTPLFKHIFQETLDKLQAAWFVWSIFLMSGNQLNRASPVFEYVCRQDRCSIYHTRFIVGFALWRHFLCRVSPDRTWFIFKCDDRLNLQFISINYVCFFSVFTTQCTTTSTAVIWELSSCVIEETRQSVSWLPLSRNN